MPQLLWVTLHYKGLLPFVAMSPKEVDENIAMVIMISILAANIATVNSALDIILYFDVVNEPNQQLNPIY